MKSRMLTVLLFLVFVFSVPLFGQTAAQLEALFETPALNWEQAAAFVLEAAETRGPGLDSFQSGEAFRFAMDEKWLPKGAIPGETARLNGISLLLMQSFGIKGGIFYGILKSPHHAYRELVYKKIIPGDTDPDMPVSGQQLLLMVGRILSAKEQS